MNTIDFWNAFLSGFSWGMAIMFSMGLVALGRFADGYREHLNNKKIEIDDWFLGSFLRLALRAHCKLLYGR